MPFPTPHEFVPWPKYLYLWIAPDGRVIKKTKEKSLMVWRIFFQKYMLMKDHTSPKKDELGWLGENWLEFPLIVVDPSIVEAKDPSQII